MRAMLVSFLFAALVASSSDANQIATQTDWSGGPGVEGPVLAFGDAFFSSSLVDWEGAAGRLALRLAPVAAPQEITVANNYCTASLFAADVDGDGDLDLVAGHKYVNEIDWFENPGGRARAWTRHSVGVLDVPISVHAADVDGDLDTDIVAASYGDDLVAWFENKDGLGLVWESRVIDAIQYSNAMSVYAADLDGDFDTDVIAAFNGDDVFWYKNANGLGTSWEKHLIDDHLTNAPNCVCAADMDGDKEIDVLGVGYFSGDQLCWYENAGGGSAWIEHVISNALIGASCMFPADIDGDGDMDVAAVADYLLYDTEGLRWWENTDGYGTNWTMHLVDAGFRAYDGDRTVCAADMDADVDLCTASWFQNETAWWSNDDGHGTSWTKRVAGSLGSDFSVLAADLDGDGRPELAGSSRAYYTGDVSWWDVAAYQNGELVSSILDTENGPKWEWIAWTADTPAGTQVRFQVRASADPGDMGPWSGIIAAPSTLKGLVPNGARYFQYRALLETADGDATPVLHDVSVSYKKLPARPALPCR